MTINYPVSMGLHPWFANTISLKEAENKLLQLVQTPNCLAIGEIGLDSNYPYFSEQIKVFELQLAIAKELKLPVIIHQVKSQEQLHKSLKNFDGTIILHGYNGSIEQWKQLNFHNKTNISIGKNALNPSKKLHTCIQQIPAEKVFAETDTSLLPISSIYKAISAIRSEPIIHTVQFINTNFERVFTPN
ncbi:MAG: TatD family hydrolase [Bacteroidia bacterium]|nr:TatD family hydrolase [Bacteroidia bacterium]